MRIPGIAAKAGGARRRVMRASQALALHRIRDTRIT
jgi:hypothetical protein